MGTLLWARSWGAVALRSQLTAFSPLTQYLVSIPLRMFRLWAFTGMMAQVSTKGLLCARGSQPVVTTVS